MSQVDLLNALQHDDRVINSAAAVMYRIREPKGSTRLSFEQLSPRKQERNRELALQILRAVLERYPDPARVSSPEDVKVFLAEQMYKMLAPKKSESFPFDQRTPFARTYYQERAEAFLRDFLVPLAEQTQRQSPARPMASSKTESLSSAKPNASRLPPTRSAQSLPPGTEPLAVDTTGRLEAESTSSTKHSDPAARSSTPASSSEGSSDALTMIGCLLFVIVILLLILVIRTF